MNIYQHNEKSIKGVWKRIQPRAPQVRAAGAFLWRFRVVVALLITLGVFGAEFYALKIPKASAAYTISNSARFISGNSDNLTKTFGTPTSQNIFTFSAWVKRGKLGVLQNIFGVSTNYSFGFPAADTLAVTIAGTAQATTPGVYRDPAAWLHVMYVQNGTAITVYVNGVSVATGTGTNSQFNTAVAHQIGSSNSANFYDGYMSDVYFVDGQALDPTNFGQMDANGYWRPKSYTGTFGTNGFHLAFGNSAALGTDTSGNSNTWTVGGLAATDQMLDTPTNSFATGNPISPGGSPTYTQGNLVSSGAATSTIFMPTGKWYWEVTAKAAGVSAGVMSNVGSSVTTSVTNNTTTGFEFDADAGTLASTTDGSTFIGTVSGLTGGRFAYATGGSNLFIFGAGGTTTLTFDSSSGGSFRFTPPTGYKALSTVNLPVPTIAVPKNYFDAGLYTGWGAAQTITAVATKRIFLTSGTSFTVPSDWNSSNNSIEVIGGGGGGGGGAGSDGTSGGGGAYSKALNVSLTAGGSVAYAVGAGGFGGAVSSAGTTGGDTYFCNSASNCASISGSAVVAGAKGGVAGNNGCGGGSGGSSASGIGSTKYSGGSGGCGVSPTVAGGAGGAAGPNGAGNGNSSSAGGSGDSGIGGAGGAAGSAGNVGKEWIDMTGTIAGSGGGAGGGSSATGPAGGAYGGGGGGGVISPGNTVGGAGAQGIIVVTYTPSGIGFTPDLVWIKDRTSANAHGIFDAVRTGSTNTLFSYTGASQSFVVPAGVTSINFKAWGAGGGGGGGAGAVGGAGGYVNATSIAVTPGESLTVNVGGGGQTSINQASWQGAGGGMTSLLRGSTLLAVAAAGGGSSFGGPGGDGGGTTGSGGTSPNGGGGTQSAGGSAGTGATAGSAGQGGRAASGVATDSVGGYNGGAAGDGDNSTWTSGGGGGGYFGGGGGGNNSGGGNGGGGSSYYGASGSTSQGSGTTAPQTSDVDYPGGTVGKGGAVKGNGGNGYAVISYSDAASHPYWSSNANTAETNSATALTSFLTNGFSLGTQALFNTSGNNYISWLWKKSPTTDGVDIVTYTGTGAAHTVAHSLGAVPDMIIVKRRDTIGDAAVYHTSQAASPQNNFLLLDSTAATAADSTYWNNTAPTSAVFTVGTNTNVDANTGTYVAYLFKKVSGFSDFGTYTGNGAADGPFVYTGFKPRYILCKRTDSTADWAVLDSARDPYNVSTNNLYPDLTNAENTTGQQADFLVNGFKVRTATGCNVSTATYIYAAFADVPFYYSAQSAASGFVQAIAFLMGMTF